MPIIDDDSFKEIPFRKPNNLKIGITINLINRNNSTKIKSQNKKVLAVGFNHKKYSKKRVKKKYKHPKERNKITPLINSFT
ncbi:hypothetical protein OBPA_02090 [Polaribacter sp. OB-PA-B3]